jgi:hypothetical protein
MGTLNWDEIERSVKSGKKTQGGGRRLFLDTDDPADIRFIGLDNKEPFIYKRHYDAKSKRYIVCAEDHAKAGEHEGCVVCILAKTLRGKDARVKSPQRLYAVTVFDPRKYHFVESKPAGEQYQPCTEDEGTCRWCRKNVERKINGVRHWSIPEAVIMQLRTFERDALGKRCGRCDGGRIKVTGYECPVCETEMEPDDPNEELRCIACEKEMGKKPVLRKPKEVIECKNCGPKGRRITLADAWISVTKTGNKKQTSYNFTVGEVEPFDAEAVVADFKDMDAKKITAINFADHPDFQPPSAAEMAAILGVRNPFAKGGKDDDDDDEDADRTMKFKGRRTKDEDDDDDEDDAPKAKKRKAAADDDDEDEDDPPKKKRRSRDDDDDEDDKIFD